MNVLTRTDELALQTIIAALANAWNAGDADGFAAQFAGDAQQVNIFGTELIGRNAIRERHDRIFKTIFNASTNTLRITGARYAAPDVILARISSTVDVSQGPLRGPLRTIGSLVLHRDNGEWKIILFHNTRIEE